MFESCISFRFESQNLPLIFITRAVSPVKLCGPTTIYNDDILSSDTTAGNSSFGFIAFCRRFAKGNILRLIINNNNSFAILLP